MTCWASDEHAQGSCEIVTRASGLCWLEERIVVVEVSGGPEKVTQADCPAVHQAKLTLVVPP